jgi:putative CocE/NonD family hydrolase
MEKFSLKATLVYTLFIIVQQCFGQGNEATAITYSRQEVLILARDGVKLNTVIFTPENVNEPLPFIFLRTPYGVSTKPSPEKNTYISDMANEGYIFVFQDIRGRYKSEGTFVMQRPMRDKNDPAAIDESTDTYDTIEWLLKNVPGNNGKVGMLGISYDGWTTMMGAVDPHPALKAASEQATPSDMFIGDDFHHNGAFRLSYGFEYAYMTEHSKVSEQFPFDEYDTYEWYLELGPLCNVNKKYFKGQLPTWNDYVNHPNYDDFWQKQSMVYRLSTPKVPLLHVAGWWDQEDYYGPLKAYEFLEKSDSTHLNFIAIGPWNHGGWSRGSGDRLGNIIFGQPTSETFRKAVQAPFFAFYLKGKGVNQVREAMTFQTGSNIWIGYNEWPPLKTTTIRNLYLNPDGRLSFDQQYDKILFDEYLSDPFHPVPYRTRPIEVTYGPGSRWSTWLVEDQRFVHNRPDVMSWETEVLEKDLTVTGNLLADMFASTSGSDADWVVKLIDVYPETWPDKPEMGGYQLMIANDVFRGRFRNSYSAPAPVKPGEVNEYKVDLHAVNHVFKKGHRIMIQVQSSWFPIIDRNPQKYVPNIFEASEKDFIVAHQRIYRSQKYPSHIKLPVADK